MSNLFWTTSWLGGDGLRFVKRSLGTLDHHVCIRSDTNTEAKFTSETAQVGHNFGPQPGKELHQGNYLTAGPKFLLW